MMECFSVNSGSNGNCIYVEAEGVRLLLDAGVSGRRTAERLAECGRDIHDVDAVIISHDHADHVGCAGILNRKFGLPVYMTPRTHDVGKRYARLGRIDDLKYFQPGETLEFGPVKVYTITTPHDAIEPVMFVVSAGGKRLGVLTDLGCVFEGLAETIATLDGVFLESNYDPRMLATGPYPAAVKRRIVGDGGHLSNAESAELLAAAADGRLQWAALSHLSGSNNTPATALRTHADIGGDRRPTHVAGRGGASKLLRVE